MVSSACLCLYYSLYLMHLRMPQLHHLSYQTMNLFFAFCNYYQKTLVYLGVHLHAGQKKTIIHRRMLLLQLFIYCFCFLLFLMMMCCRSGLKVGQMTRTIQVTWVAFFAGQSGLIHKINYPDVTRVI